MEKGYVHVYTGNGKGKTTAALGLCIRALGAGKKVFLAEFVKSMEYSEINLLKKMDQIDIKLYGNGCFLIEKPTQEDVLAAREGIRDVLQIMKTKNYDVIVLDEIFIAIYFKLITEDEVLSLLDNKPESVELILTGRYCPESIIKRADLVTEMKEIKHYYTQGVLSRSGIDK